MTYIILLILVLVSGAISYYQKRFNQEKLFLVVTYIPLVFVAGFRGQTVGVDTKSYIEIFDYVKNVSMRSIIVGDNRYASIEKGYLIWNKLISYISHDSQLMILLNTMVFIFIVFIFIYRSNINVFLGVFLFLTGGMYFLFFNLMRQMLAISFLSLSFLYFQEKKYKTVFFFFLLSISFHSISIIYLLVYMFSMIKINRKKINMLLLTLILIMSNYRIFLGLFINIMPKFDKYANNKGVINSINGIVLFFIFDILLLLIVLYFSKKEIERNIYIYGFLTMCYVSFMILGSKFNYMDRVGLLFKPFEILFILTTLDFLIRDKNTKILIYYVLIVVMSIFFIWSSISSKQMQYSIYI